MQRFIKDIALFGAVQLLLLCALGLFGPGLQRHYTAATIEKHRRAADAGSPRLFLVGGSSVAFGIDSRVFEQALDRHPVNLGLNAMLGMEFALNEIEDLAAAGDAVVLSFEHPQLWSDHTSEAVLVAVAARPANAAYVDAGELGFLLDRGFLALRDWLRGGLRSGNVFARANFNEYGDFVGHHGKPSIYQRSETAITEPLDRRFLRAAIERLNLCGRRLEARGAAVFFALPAVSRHFHDRAEARLEQVTRQLHEQLAIPILGDAARLVYPDELFFDSAYHLTQQGKQRRTAELLPALQTALEHRSRTDTFGGGTP